MGAAGNRDAGLGGGAGSGGTGGGFTDASTAPDGAQDAVARDAAIACTDDGGQRLASAARSCQTDNDCQITARTTCCGPDNAFGIASSQVSAYAGCFALPAGGCGPLGCAKYLGYATDDGELTRVEGVGANPLGQVRVHCVNHLCTTSVAPAVDASDAAAGRD